MSITSKCERLGWVAIVLAAVSWGLRWEERANRLKRERDIYYRMAKPRDSLAAVAWAYGEPPEVVVNNPVRITGSVPDGTMADVLRHINTYKDRPISSYGQGGVLR